MSADSLNKNEINIDQAANNIDAFIDGKSPERLAMVLYRLSDGNLNGKMDAQEYYNASAVLKSFSILKYELRKKEPGKEEAYAIQFQLNMTGHYSFSFTSKISSP